MIVQKPQFDESVLKVGHVWWLKRKDNRAFNSLNTACMIQSIKPFIMNVRYYDGSNFKDLDIGINEIVNKVIILKFMDVIEDDNEC